MAEGEDRKGNEREPFSVVVARLRRERDQRLAELPEKLAKEPVEPDPGLKELVDTQPEFRARIMGHLAKIIS